MHAVAPYEGQRDRGQPVVLTGETSDAAWIAEVETARTSLDPFRSWDERASCNAIALPPGLRAFEIVLAEIHERFLPWAAHLRCNKLSQPSARSLAFGNKIICPLRMGSRRKARGRVSS